MRYVSSVKELGRPDLVIIPGTKSTIEDLLWMRSCGLEAAVKKLAGAEIPVFGICGGYQIMGNTITDKEGAEQKAGSPNTQVRGMELLPIDTEFETEKVRTRVAGTFDQVTGILKELSGLEIEGYEIHMGISHSADPDAGFIDPGNRNPEKFNNIFDLQIAETGRYFLRKLLRYISSRHFRPSRCGRSDHQNPVKEQRTGWRDRSSFRLSAI